MAAKEASATRSNQATTTVASRTSLLSCVPAGSARGDSFRRAPDPGRKPDRAPP